MQRKSDSVWARSTSQLAFKPYTYFNLLLKVRTICHVTVACSSAIEPTRIPSMILTTTSKATQEVISPVTSSGARHCDGEEGQVNAYKRGWYLMVATLVGRIDLAYNYPSTGLECWHWSGTKFRVREAGIEERVPSFKV
jgi:hypothetical protein